MTPQCATGAGAPGTGAVSRVRLAPGAAGRPAVVASLAALALLAALLAAPLPAHARGGPRDDSSARHPCSGRAERCGAGVIIDGGLRGVDNCRSDPNCRTRRIVDNHDPQRGSDFIPVPDWPVPHGGGRRGGGGANGSDGGTGAVGAGAGTGGGAEAGGSGAPGGAPAGGPPAPRCVRRAPGRVAPDFSQVSLPGGRIGASPRHAHLTGLESWFWYEGAAAVAWASPVYVGISADCEVVPAPPAVTYRADLVAFTWRLADTRPVTVAAPHRGSEANPAARHVYETSGTWPVAVVCTWRGGWGGEAQVPCGERDVEVVEVRGRLKAGP
jgi:hypothetical protein